MPRAEIVDKNANLDAPGNRSAQGLDEAIAGDIVVEDVHAQGDGVLGLVDSLQHRRVSLIAVPEWHDRVAVAERLPGDGFADLNERLKMSRLIRKCRTPCLGKSSRRVRKRFGASGPTTQSTCPTFDAIDPEQEIEQNANDRHKPEDRNPGKRRPGITLEKNDVAGDDDGERNRRHDGEPRPIS